MVVDGRTQYALPSILPRSGAGILLLEELNRAERYIQQPALQFLSARRLFKTMRHGRATQHHILVTRLKKIAD